MPSRESRRSAETSDGERAVAAAALVAAQHPDGGLTCSNYGPSEPLPKLPADLRTLAVEALDQVVSERSDSPNFGTTLRTARSGTTTSPAFATSLTPRSLRKRKPSSPSERSPTVTRHRNWTRASR
ncbi:DUF4259 domain-containing protein [Streptomyces hirsutus]|uniref:DUF4259 domain-containing protein n=1 Tax=Streptomyces hirsutus TaxID=35620 RepID=UPI0036252E02